MNDYPDCANCPHNYLDHTAYGKCLTMINNPTHPNIADRCGCPGFAVKK